MAAGVGLAIIGPEQGGQTVAAEGPGGDGHIGQQRPGFAMVQGNGTAVARQAWRAKEV